MLERIQRIEDEIHSYEEIFFKLSRKKLVFHKNLYKLNKCEILLLIENFPTSMAKLIQYGNSLGIYYNQVKNHLQKCDFCYKSYSGIIFYHQLISIFDTSDYTIKCSHCYNKDKCTI